jgi:hypothetical protein
MGLYHVIGYDPTIDTLLALTAAFGGWISPLFGSTRPRRTELL